MCQNQDLFFIQKGIRILFLQYKAREQTSSAAEIRPQICQKLDYISHGTWHEKVIAFQYLISLAMVLSDFLSHVPGSCFNVATLEKQRKKGKIQQKKIPKTTAQFSDCVLIIFVSFLPYLLVSGPKLDF